MSDNWSAYTRLDNRWDYLKWTFTLGSDDADRLNGLVDEDDGDFTIRAAKLDAADSPDQLYSINDWLCAFDGFGSGSQTDDDRFMYAPGVNPTGNSNQILYRSAGDALNVRLIAGDPGEDKRPFVTGTNTIKVINNSDDPFDVDHMMLVTHGRNLYPGTKDQVTGEASPAAYAAYPNGTAWGSGASYPYFQTGSYRWFLKAPDATTGSMADEPTVDPISLCLHGDNLVYRVRLHVDGTPVEGDVGLGFWTGAASVFDRQTLIDGRATLTIPYSPSADIAFWFGGNDTTQPADASIDGSSPFNCGGWHIGRIGVS